MADKIKAITFNDTQNGQTKTYKMAVGTKITITNSVYEVRQDGVYQLVEKEVPKRNILNFGQTETVTEAHKIDANTLNVILPQLSAISLFDANKDGTIDRNDSLAIEQKADEYDVCIDGCKMKEYFAEKLDDALRASKSKYSVEQNGGGSVSTFVNGNIFSASFENQIWQYPEGREVKSIFIELPE